MKRRSFADGREQHQGPNTSAETVHERSAPVSKTEPHRTQAHLTLSPPCDSIPRLPNTIIIGRNLGLAHISVFALITLASHCELFTPLRPYALSPFAYPSRSFLTPRSESFAGIGLSRVGAFRSSVTQLQHASR
ncbi:hypothetical protein N7495_002206 [Penicillium taxi]|uniref:uncharacterized protein n=1 Tax=Penicillium taxi TaxID=168475 RepID=UPI0025453308|nr:uncharacterized protein N7495_002206 [Penicillium taxi]KAJ5901678.1 hypothetical protein N7495_002206 [Penicillium taxi]